LVLSATFKKEIVVGSRTDCHQVTSAEPTAISTNNKDLHKMMSFSAEQTPTQKYLCCLQNRLPSGDFCRTNSNKLTKQMQPTVLQVYHLTFCVAQHVLVASTPIIKSLQLH
jgi:hypothetical protein